MKDLTALLKRMAYAAHCLLLPRHAERRLNSQVRRNLDTYRNMLRNEGLNANIRANWRD